MGIDPVTHEPLHKEEETSSKEQINNNQSNFGGDQQQQLSLKDCDHVSSSSADNNSSSSTDESPSLDPNCSEDDLLMSYILSDAFLDNSSWNFMATTKDDDQEFGLCNWSDESSSSWLLDYQDLKDEDLGTAYLNDMSMSIAPPEMNGNKH
ncbi:protein ODORANT1-like [Tripterygium wilfordii]|uniref:Protein ODORANT1-like n=2 Tax=Tripterygium wilfordii TaxID=458696 RepID=A0A7J7CB49_TRIWF|nr:protein ODORANT1-like [Tripterygium wilfordii]